MAYQPTEKAETILKIFQDINRIPRGSGKEEALGLWIQGWAEAQGFEAERDSAGNRLVRVPGSPGYENSPTVILQGHMDMVCEKNPGSSHDFEKDPIRGERQGEWLVASETTLGADDGIALAAAMAAALDPEVVHPPLELLFTVDEETGLTGASSLEGGWLKGRILINIDSEDEGVFTIGCAGGVENHLRLPAARKTAGEGQVFALSVSGLRGGHSGVDIHERRGNALRLLARVLEEIRRDIDLEVISLSGGNAHNAIPRNAEALILTAPGNLRALEELTSSFEEDFRGEFGDVEPSLALTVRPAPPAEEVLDSLAVDRALALLLTLPHGVDGFSREVEGLVETSSNMASLRMEPEALFFQTSQRSTLSSRLEELTRRIEEIARLAGAGADRVNAYPSWEPSLDSPLLKTSREVYQRLFSRDPVIEIIHAGLECGVIGAKYPGMDMISMGPTIQGVHAPGEKLYLPSLDKLWNFLAALLEELARAGG